MPALEIIELKKTWLISLNYGRKDKLYYSNILLRKVLVYFNALQRSFWLKKKYWTGADGPRLCSQHSGDSEEG